MDDSISTRISPSCPPETQQILTASWSHDVAAVNKLLDTPGRASARDPVTGETPLHAAIRSLGPAPGSEASEEEMREDVEAVEAAEKTVRELLLWGAIWNDVDDRDETPGCLAARLGRTEMYNLCVEAGVRAELLFGLMEGYEELSSGEEDEGMEGEEEGDHVEIEMEDGHVNGEPEDGDEAPELVHMEQKEQQPDPEQEATNGQADVNSEEYLRSNLTYSDRKLVDGDQNGVMMAWETDIMKQSVDALLNGEEGKRILNVGFGMGIIDGMFADTKPRRHHIIEAHPEVLKYISAPESKFGAQWEASGPEEGAFKVYPGKWQEVCNELLADGQVYDAIYFDTFGEDYKQLREFFTGYMPGLLDQDGVFGFFNGLGADRKICYDVYTKVVEMHLADAGMDVDWKVIDVDLKGLEEAGKGEWEGVRRRYWTLDKYRLPVCTFLG